MIKTTKNINKFKGYDKTVAKCHLHNFGIIYYYDGINEPLEVEEVLEILDKEDEKMKRYHMNLTNARQKAEAWYYSCLNQLEIDDPYSCQFLIDELARAYMYNEDVEDVEQDMYDYLKKEYKKED